ncbi:hypothetical protein Tco_0892700 [Tanacetum coccineum]|uniref:GAG-pre-integrase domain-containing protein n=1 Tax=Tanacetum coccineum TaxID=301880 RepID=A0ABQ5C803_9ASTR
MDSMILIGQKNTFAEYMILSGADNRPPILDKDLWVTRHRNMLNVATEENQVIVRDLKATNIILQGLPSDIYSLVNHYRVANDLWERIQLLMQGTSLTKQERECKLYDVFDKFAHIKGESLHQYYLRFTQLINDMNIYKKKLEQFQVNTKFLNSLPHEWSKFMTDVKLVKDLHTTNLDQLHAYLQQHELHAHEVRIMRERNHDPLALIDSGLAVPVFKQGNDPIDAINKMMSFLSIVVSSRFPTTNNQLRNSSNPRQQATIYDGRVIVQPVQGRQNSFAAGTSGTRANISRIAKAVLMANLSSYGSDVLSEVPHSENNHNDMLNQSVQEMPYSEQTHFVNYPENEITSDSNIIPYSQYLLETQNTTIKDTNSSTQQDAMILYVFEQLSNQVTNCNKVNKNNLIANESLSVELERYKERVKLLKERQNVDLSTQEKLIIDDIIQDKNAQFADFEKEINYLKQTLSEQSKEKELLTKTFNVFKNGIKDKGIFYNNNLKQALGFQNPFYLKKAQQIRSMLYDGNVIAKETNVISIADSKETLMLEEESRSKMLLKQSDPMVLEKKVNTKPINYDELNRLFEDFSKHFVPQRELSDEKALHPNTDQSASSPVKIEALRELPKCNKCLELEAELLKQHNMVEKYEYNKLLKSFSKLEQYFISLELAMQLNKETFQKNNTSVNQTEPTFDHLFELNNLKAELQAKDTTIEKLKANIKVSRSTKSSRSKSTDNTKNDRILQISSRTQKKNKVEDHSRIVNSMFDARHELCFLEFVSDMNASSKSKSVKKAKKKEEWKPTGKVITATNKVPLREPIPLEVVAQESVVTKVYTRRPKVVQIVLWYLDSGCSKHMTGDRSQLTNFVHKFLGTVKFGNDQIAKIMGYGDYQIGNITNSQGSRETNLYTLSIGDIMASSPICFLSKASKTKSWLWHRRLSHLNFGVLLIHLARLVSYEGTTISFAHGSLWGLCVLPSINGNKVILFIVDDSSGSRWSEAISNKDEAPIL